MINSKSNDFNKFLAYRVVQFFDRTKEKVLRKKKQRYFEVVVIITKRHKIQLFYLLVTLLLVYGALNSFQLKMCILSDNPEVVSDTVSDWQEIIPTLFPLWEIQLLQIQHSQSTLSFHEFSSILGINSRIYLPTLILSTLTADHQAWKKKVADIPKNRVILKETIDENPGITLREIQRKTGLAMGVVQYHIHCLEKEEISSFKNGRSRHFFDKQTPLTHEERLWFALNRNSKIRTILEYIQTNDGECLQRDLVSHTGLSRSLVSYYIKILRNNGIINSENNHLQLSMNILSPSKRE